jgi:hypothetical protein
MEKINNIKLTCNHQIKAPNGIIRNCKNKVKTSEYCHIHMKLSQIKIPTEMLSIDIQYLDENFNYTLMGLYNSWNDMDKGEILYMDREYWNVHIIISHFTQQLNMSSMENPYPIYPNSPFTRKPFSVGSLIILRDKIKRLGIPINIALKLLLSQSIGNLQLIYDNINNSTSNKLLELFETNYRYMLINSKNSQNVYTGFWVSENFPLTQFEKFYNELKTVPYQTVINGYIMLNNERNIIENKMTRCKNKFNIYDKKFCELII